MQISYLARLGCVRISAPAGGALAELKVSRETNVHSSEMVNSTKTRREARCVVCNCAALSSCDGLPPRRSPCVVTCAGLAPFQSDSGEFCTTPGQLVIFEGDFHRGRLTLKSAVGHKWAGRRPGGTRNSAPLRPSPAPGATRRDGPAARQLSENRRAPRAAVIRAANLERLLIKELPVMSAEPVWCEPTSRWIPSVTMSYAQIIGGKDPENPVLPTL